MDITKPTNKKPVKVYIINDIDSLEDFEKALRNLIILRKEWNLN